MNLIQNKEMIDEFLNKIIMPLKEDEIYYCSIMARYKYNKEIKKKKSSVIQRNFFNKKEEILEFLTDCPIAEKYPPDCISCYLSLNPKSISKANNEILIELATNLTKRIIKNPMPLVEKHIAKSVGTKYFVDFDFDTKNPEQVVNFIKGIIPSVKTINIKSKNGIHIVVPIKQLKCESKDWYSKITKHEECDVNGSCMLTPIPGTRQGDFTPIVL